MTRFTAALTALLIAGSAQAGQITLNAPMQAASLHEPGVDMVVFYTEAGSAFEVVATYIETDAPDAPARLRMAFEDGDNVTFGLPGQTQTSYNFHREGDALTVTSTTKIELAQKK